MPLCVSRKIDETIEIGDDVIVKIIRIEKSQVGISITAPPHIWIRRGELKHKVRNAVEEIYKGRNRFVTK